MNILSSENKDTLGGKIFSRLFCDPVLIYTVVVMMSVMNHYRSSLIWGYGLATWLISALIFRLFDYIAKHKFIGSVAYIALFAGFMLAGKYFVDFGYYDYHNISFGVWFLTPQDALEYNAWYTLALYCYFLIFMTSVIYYFSKIRYRIFMNFLIFIIPFAVYAKEYEKMPTVFIILLAIGYVVLMVYCRQLTEKSNTVIISKERMWKSTAAYVVIFATIAALIPKPVIEADREILDRLIAADAFTDRLLETVGIFRDTAEGDTFRENQSEQFLFFARADEPLRLKTTTYTTYDYTNDSWSVSEADTRFEYTTEDHDIREYAIDETSAIIAFAAENYEDFAEKYCLEGLTADSIEPAETLTVQLYTLNHRAQFAPVPTLMTKLSSTTYKNEIAQTRSGLIYCVEGRFSYDEHFNYEYCSDWFLYNPKNKEIIYMFSRDDYVDLLEDACDILLLNYPDKSDVLDSALYEAKYRASDYLDYGDNKQIKELADEITEGCVSDLDKARAIERYFTDKGYLYDLNYRKGKNDNVVNFIFDAKRGVCYEYATAMVLLSRAAGVPARYAEGYNMSEQYSNSELGTNYVVRSRSAHGFPELYIRGAGWVSFEPTVSTMAPDENASRAVDSLAYGGFVLLATTLLFLLGVKLYPTAVHKIFLIRVKKMAPEEAAVAIMHRICRIYKLEQTFTSHEAADIIYVETSSNVHFSADLFDKAVYGKFSVTEAEKKRALSEYLALYETLKSIKKTKHKKSQQNA